MTGSPAGQESPRTLVIVNRTASAGRAGRLWSRLQAESALPDHFDHAFTTYAGHTVKLASEAVRAGYELIVAFGGDGTVHETVNGLMQDDRAGAALGIIPAGTGNDIAKTLGVPMNPRQACRQLGRLQPRAVDLARVLDRYYVGIAGAGFDAEVAAFANRWPKYLPGTITYVLGILLLLATFKPFEAELVVDGVTRKRRLWLLAVGNGQYYGSGMRMCPGARVDDKLVDVIEIGPLGRLAILRLLPTLFKGRHILNPMVTCYRAQEVRLEATAKLSVQADGEQVGNLPATFRVLPGVLPVVTGEFLPPMEMQVPDRVPGPE